MGSAVVAPAAPPAETRSLSLGGLIVLAFGTADFGLESSIVLPALPVIAQEYSASLISVSWLATGFLLASVVAVPLFGRLGDLFGRRRLLLIGLGAFMVGSLICAVADSIGLLIAGRIVQGGGAAVGPLAFGIVRDTLPREQVEWGWDSGRVVVLFAGAAALLAAFLLVEHRVRQPLIEPAFVTKRPFIQAHVCALAVGVAFAAVVIVVPQIAALPEVTGYGLGYSVTSTGLLLVPMALGSIVAAWIAGRVVDVIGPRALMAVGSASALAAYLLLRAEHDAAAPIATGAAGVGLAVGFCVTAIISVVGRAAPLDNTSAAVAVHAVVRTSGIAVGTAVTAAIITGAGLVGPLPAESGYSDAFLMGAIASGCALLASALLPGRR